MEVSRMSDCCYCDQPSLATLTDKQYRVCQCCLRLVRHEKWQALALHWLERRPQDWVGDVAAWLECTYGRDCDQGA